jgi:hypothetical protein
MNQLILPIGKELKRKDYDKNLSKYPLTMEDFEELKKEGDDSAEGLDYEDFCEAEREGWSDCVKAVLRKPYEAVDVLPITCFWRGSIKPVRQEKVELLKQLPSTFEAEIIVEECIGGDAE